MLQKLTKIYHILQEIRTLPKVRINVKCDSDTCRELYGLFYEAPSPLSRHSQ